MVYFPQLFPPKSIPLCGMLSTVNVYVNSESKFYIRGSVLRNSRLKKSNEMQQYADIYLLLNYSTCFGRPSRPSSEVHKTVVAPSGNLAVNIYLRTVASRWISPT